MLSLLLLRWAGAPNGKPASHQPTACERRRDRVGAARHEFSRPLPGTQLQRWAFSGARVYGKGYGCVPRED